MAEEKAAAILLNAQEEERGILILCFNIVLFVFFIFMIIPLLFFSADAELKLAQEKASELLKIAQEEANGTQLSFSFVL